MSAHPATSGAPGHDDGIEDTHLPHGSIWPFLVSIGISLLGLGFIVGPWLVAVGFVATVGTLIGWFREDHKWWPQRIGTGLSIPKAGTLLFISSEIFLFGALFANFFTYRGTALEHGPWPDADVHLPLLTTGIFSLFLFASSATLHKAESALKRGHHLAFRNWWLLTIVLGLIFLGGQVNEYMELIHEGHVLGSSHFMTAFFMLTGTHGLHVFGGLCFLTLVYVRAMKGHFDEKRHTAPECAGLYWHFVDIVWVFVYGVVYLWTFLL